MRSFFVSLLGSLSALLIFVMGLSFVALLALVAIVAASKQDHRSGVEEGAYLVFRLDTNIQDAPAGADLSAMLEDRGSSLQLRPTIRAIQAAAKDSRIAGVFLTGSFNPLGYGSSFAALKELRSALAEVRAAGKPVVAHLEFAETRDLYIASVASDLSLDPFGAILLPGLAARPTFYAGALEKFGIGVQVTRVGKYKSAVEPFLRRDLSPENREQLGQLLGDLWGDLVTDIATSRKLTPEALQRIVDQEGLLQGEAARTAGLADRILYRDQVIDELKEKTGRKGSKESFKQVALSDYVTQLNPKSLAKVSNPSKGKVAVIYAEGEIVDGEGGHGMVGGESFSKEIRRLRQDEHIKAIVLRVNSPGGSASASEAILREIRLAREKMPVVVSMGGYAASGGYWISTYGTHIFAEPATITGSIGVFGLFFDVEGLAGKLGLSFDTVKTGRYADMATVTRPKTTEELAVMQRMVDGIYDSFIDRVSESRNLPREKVLEIAQGRVWSGTAALKLGLVDEIGGLGAAIREAGILAGLGENPAIIEYPRAKELAELIAEFFQRFQSGARAKTMLGKVSARVEEELLVLSRFNDPRGIYARMPLLVKPE